MILLNARRRAWRHTADALAVAYRCAAHRRDLLAPEGSRALERARRQTVTDTPPPLAPLRIRARWTRTRARWALGRYLRRLADHLDPLHTSTTEPVRIHNASGRIVVNLDPPRPGEEDAVRETRRRFRP